ncbi:hypothetical protein DPMN_126132 [Dreissena polymorpha]|uniref:Uncharacterized protein n=1 Tax=Dreissena polymorpha TaxID=45954 RepID=A0A9D4JXU6_DREPO|nr:hypothetical protein DPMN_126132 [Dreissena polymorpha]
MYDKAFVNNLLHLFVPTLRALVDCLASSMEKSEMKPGRLVVDTGNTIQKIALQKYIAAECKCEVRDFI